MGPNPVFRFFSSLLSDDDGDAGADQALGAAGSDFSKSLLPPEQDERFLEDKPDAFLARLDETLSQHRDVVAGQVYFINLDRVRAHFAGQWDKLSKKIHRLARREIQHHLGPADLVSPHGPLAYLIVFANLTGEQAQLKSALIARAVSEALMGRDATGVLVDAQSVVIQKDGKLVGAAVRSIDELNDRLSQAAAKAARVRPSGTLVVDNQKTATWQSNADQNRQIDAVLDDVTNLYYPMWNVRGRVMALYHSVPAFVDAAGEIVTGYDVLPDPLSSLMITRLDLKTIREAHAVLRDRRGQPCAVSVPVHFESLATHKAASRYLSACQDLDEENRRFLVFELVGLPQGIPLNRLAPLVSSLTPFGTRVIARASLDGRTVGELAGSGVAGIGLDLSHESVSESTIMRRMDMFCSKVEKAGTLSYVQGIDTTSLSSAAVCSGFDLISGQALVAPTESSLYVTHFNLDDLYRRHSG